MKLYELPWSTNVERVTLAAAHKGIELEHVTPEDRETLRVVSGQELVPVLEHEGTVVVDSPMILAYLEEIVPDPTIYPGNRAAIEIFIDWFNRVWKVAPNSIAETGEPDPWSAEMQRHLDWFEVLLGDRTFLFGEALSAADFVAFPFLKYAAGRNRADDELFHRVLEEHQSVAGRPALRAWIERMDARPRA